jgi:hypothetical protein
MPGPEGAPVQQCTGATRLVGLVIAQDRPHMGLVPDEGAVWELTAASPDPAFGDRVHTGRPDVAEYGPDTDVGKDGVECGGEVRAAIADHELDPVFLLAEVHKQIARLLAGPLPCGMQRDAKDADAPRRVLDHGQDVGLGAVEQVDAEEVARQDRLGLRTQELRPGWPGPSWRGIDAVSLEDLPYGRRSDLDSQAGQFPVDPAVAPSGEMLSSTFPHVGIPPHPR